MDATSSNSNPPLIGDLMYLGEAIGDFARGDRAPPACLGDLPESISILILGLLDLPLFSSCWLPAVVFLILSLLSRLAKGLFDLSTGFGDLGPK